ncbi:hypothetical protein H2248_004308 [Termitomyces sp. 'cryptogamus']|nr:hypothetical protein H2248_004308 [Termitomyces sp. 'cryptogamus']
MEPLSSADSDLICFVEMIANATRFSFCIPDSTDTAIFSHKTESLDEVNAVYWTDSDQWACPYEAREGRQLEIIPIGGFNGFVVSAAVWK